MKREPKTFDYTLRMWGHDVAFEPIDNGQKLRANGWGPAPRDGSELSREWMEVGDFIILSHPGTDKTARYRIEKIRYARDPSDQWFADLSFAPRPARAADEELPPPPRRPRPLLERLARLDKLLGKIS